MATIRPDSVKVIITTPDGEVLENITVVCRDWQEDVPAYNQQITLSCDIANTIGSYHETTDE